MTGILVLFILGAPASAILVMLARPLPRLAETINLIAAVIVFVAAIALVPAALDGTRIFLHGYILADPLGAWVILCAAIVYLLASIYAIGYMRTLGEEDRLTRFYALFAAFALTIMAAPLMNNPGVYWIAIEMTTVVSTFLVAFERAPESIEAAWKYIIVVSAGISLALLGTILFYWNGTFTLGPTYAMTWATLRAVAPRMNRPLLILGFLLVLVGYGTKVGLAPMHTWLPDAHSEGPAPVSALLSGALLNTAMTGIVRYLAVMHHAGMAVLPNALMIAFGAFSLFIAAMFIVRQRGVKRLMAYSSVEHMGVIALGFGFGGAFGIAGALYHMLNHSLNKSLMFFGAGNAMRSYGTKAMAQIRGFGRRFPVSGTLWLAGAVAITGAPPFGLFQSEISILHAGFAGPQVVAALFMALLLIVIFIAFLNHFRGMFYEPEPPESQSVARPSRWCVAPMWLALVPLLVFGLWWPAVFWRDFQVIAQVIEAPVHPALQAALIRGPA